MADNEATPSALNRKRQELEEKHIEPADHLVENGASLLCDSTVLLGGLVDAVCDGGSEGSVHALRCQVAYLRWKVNAQHTTHERLRSMIEDLLEAVEMRIAEQTVQAKASAKSKQKLMSLKEDVEEKQKELAAANDEASFLVNEVINLQNIVSVKDRQLEELQEAVLVQDRIISEHEKVAVANERKILEISGKSAHLSHETSKLRDIISAKEALILSKDEELAKKDDMLLELKKTLATKNTEHALAVKNAELAVRRCNNLQFESKPKRNVMRCYRCGNKKAGIYHNTSKSCTSAEYCSTPQAERAPYWVVPAGYEVGDKRKKETQRSVIKRRKEICHEKDIVDVGWEHWGNNN